MADPGWSRSCLVALLVSAAAAAGAFETPKSVQVTLLEPTYDQVVISLTPALVELDDPDSRCAWIDVLVDGALADSFAVHQPASGRYESEIDVVASGERHLIAVQAYGEDGELLARDETRTAPLPPGGLTAFVTLVPLYATVTRNGEPVTGLTASDFTVREEGRPQPIAHFESSVRSTSIVVMLDHSFSVQGEPLRHCQQAAVSLIEALREDERAAFLSFSNRVSGVPSFTTDRAILIDAIRSAGSGGGTALNDAIYTGLELLDSQSARKALILFSDGLDAHSVLSADYVRWRVQASDALIYLVLFGREPARPYSNNWRDGEANLRQLSELEALIQESGGRLFRIGAMDQLEPVFQAILTELRSQYYLAYYDQDAQRDGSWRRLQIEAAPGGVSVRTRAGFWDR